MISGFSGRLQMILAHWFIIPSTLRHGLVTVNSHVDLVHVQREWLVYLDAQLDSLATELLQGLLAGRVPAC